MRFREVKGFYKVTQLVAGNDRYKIGERMTAFDANEWSYQWLTFGKTTVLRMSHDNDPEATDSVEYVDFSMPVEVKFEPER
jgi:hypothetical protein